LHYYLKRNEGFIVNHKKLYRLCKENNLLLPKIIKNKFPRKISINRKVTKPNQVWEFDIKYSYIHGENRHFLFWYILTFSAE
jgi:putative transposase